MSRKQDSSDALSARTPGATTARLAVQVKPNAKETKILGERNGYLHIALHAVAKDGKANEELITFLKKITGRQYKIVSGISSKKKLLKAL